MTDTAMRRKVAHDTDLKHAIESGLDEGFASLEEAIRDLTDEQVQAFPVAGENNIAWIVMHCLDNLDDCANGCASGNRVFETEWRWNLWKCQPHERPKQADPFPTTDEMLSLLRRVGTAAMTTLGQMDEPALTEKWVPHPIKKSRADFYLRTIYHTASHVRQIWLLRGALGLACGPWPEQRWA